MSIKLIHQSGCQIRTRLQTPSTPTHFCKYLASPGIPLQLHPDAPHSKELLRLVTGQNTPLGKLKLLLKNSVLKAAQCHVLNPMFKYTSLLGLKWKSPSTTTYAFHKTHLPRLAWDQTQRYSENLHRSSAVLSVFTSQTICINGLLQGTVTQQITAWDSCSHCGKRGPCETTSAYTSWLLSFLLNTGTSRSASMLMSIAYLSSIRV